MRIFVDFQIEKKLEPQLLNDNVVYRPDIEDKSSRYLAQALFLTLPNVLITRTTPDYDTLSHWRQERLNHQIFIICISDGDNLTDSVCNIPVHHIPISSDNCPELQAFIMAEHINNLNLNHETNYPVLSAITREKYHEKTTINIVGAGIVNLLTAYYLNKNDYKIDIFDAGPDPRSGLDEELLGCTHGGDDARMFSLSETRHHLSRHHLEMVHNNTSSPFQRDLHEGGWLSCDNKFLNNNDMKWMSNFECLPAWLPDIFEKDIISFNQESEPLWNELILNEPDLFQNVGYIPEVLRLYSTNKQFTDAIENEKKIHSVKRIIDLITLKQEFPALRCAIDAGKIAGAIEIVGFTVNIHKFSARLIDKLEKNGVTINWNNRINKIERNADNEVTGLSTDRKSLTADHYVISPGAYIGDLCHGMNSENQIASVVGSWLRIPNIDPALNTSLKITRSGFASDSAAVGANIIIGTGSSGESIIHVSSGHGYVGENPDNIDSQYIKDLFRVVEDTAKTYFPDCYEAAKNSGLLKSSLKYCVRPWSPTGLGIFEINKASNNGILILTGGHNTGGFAQSPGVAMAVLSALQGKEHRMHWAYHPERVSSFSIQDGLISAENSYAGHYNEPIAMKHTEEHVF